MDALYAAVALLAGLAIGWLLASSRGARHTQAAQQQMQAEREQRIATETRVQEMEKQVASPKALLEEVRAQLGDTFKALSSDALQANSQAFVERAQQTLQPLQQALKAYEDHLRELEQVRQRAYGSLEEQLRSLAATEQQLQRETSSLVTALRRPEVRGRWGELSLRRAVELAGMTEHVDYTEQPAAEAEGGRRRPDMVVQLPAGRQVVVDAKVPLDAYLSSLEAGSDDARQACLAQHCRQLREHMRALAAKSYWEQFEPTPEFVVMFVPGESFLHAACDIDHTLIEEGMRDGVVVASPTLLVAVLRAVAYGWRQEQIAKGAQEISELGRELYDRLRTFATHMADLRRRLDGATDAYNKAVGSLESRVLPSARRFRDLGAAAGGEIPELEPIDTRPRELTAPETGEPDNTTSLAPEQQSSGR